MLAILSVPQYVNTLGPRQYGRHFPGDVSKCIFENEKFRIAIQISVKFISKGPIDNIPASVYIMTWRRPGDMPLSEPMLTGFTDAYMQHLGEMS